MGSPKRLFEHFLDFCIMVAVCAFLLRVSMAWIAEAAPLLLLCAAFILSAMLGYRLWKYLRDMGKW